MAITRENYEIYKDYSEALVSGDLDIGDIIDQMIGGAIAIAKATGMTAEDVVRVLASTAPEQGDIDADLDKFAAEDAEDIMPDESEATQA